MPTDNNFKNVDSRHVKVIDVVSLVPRNQYQYNGHSIHRRSYSSDIWVCDDCKFTGDRFFFENVRVCPRNKKRNG
ncbi:MAG TPA: hypothetical protein VF884_10235 [Nitrososphaeraceae archaeon]